MRSVLMHSIVALCLFAVLQEVALRLVFPVPEIVNFDRLHYSPKAFATRDIHEANLAHASFVWKSGPDGVSFRHDLNLNGFRDREWSARPASGDTRVAFVGDSFTEGFSTDGRNTLPRVFERLARGAGMSVEAMNFGIGGAGPKQYARLMRDAIPIFQPDDVILVLYENDAVPVEFKPAWLANPRAPEFANPWKPRLAHILGERRAGRRVPRRWHAKPFSYFAAVPDHQNAWSHPEQAEKLAQIVAPDIAEHMHEGRFNPAMALFYRFVETNAPRPLDMSRYLRAVDRFIRKRGATLHLVYIPTKVQVSRTYDDYVSRYSRSNVAGDLTGPEYQIHGSDLAGTCAEIGIPFLDLGPRLREIEAGGTKLYWDYDDHFRPIGYRTAAQLILEWWREPARVPGTRRDRNAENRPR